MHKILSIDPSSTAAGWAVLDADTDRVLDAGIQKRNGDNSSARIHDIGMELESLVYNLDGLKSIIIEIPSGHVNHNRNVGRGAGLSVYGMAVGYYLGLLHSFAMQNTIDGTPMKLYVQDESWAGRSPKLSGKNSKEMPRQDKAKLLYPPYATMKDAGGDISDAICLGAYFTRRCKVPGQQTWEEWGK